MSTPELHMMVRPDRANDPGRWRTACLAAAPLEQVIEDEERITCPRCQDVVMEDRCLEDLRLTAQLMESRADSFGAPADSCARAVAAWLRSVCDRRLVWGTEDVENTEWNHAIGVAAAYLGDKAKSRRTYPQSVAH